MMFILTTHIQNFTGSPSQNSYSKKNKMHTYGKAEIKLSFHRRHNYVCKKACKESTKNSWHQLASLARL